MTVVTDTHAVPISPADIKTDLHFSDAFGDFASDVVARQIIKFCQKRNSWNPFTRNEIKSFWQNLYPDDPFSLEDLIDSGFIKRRGIRHGRYCLTLEFISRCHQASRDAHAIYL